MTDTKDNGGYAFPREEYQTPTALGQTGMTLRDWFAGQALMGICVSDKFVRSQVNTEGQAVWAYEIADAMIKARGK